MRKWYRPSFSLAGKCRFGFATAVLLIIGAALFVPYRWMDKLVEQGKREMAQVEVQHVLERHFQTGPAPMPVRQAPPLASEAGPGGRIEAGRWKRLEGLEGPGRAYAVVPAGTDGKEAAEQQPATSWVRLTESDLAALGDETQARERLDTLSDNELVRHAIRRYLEEPGRWERFSFETRPDGDSDGEPGLSGWQKLLQAWLPGEPTAQYVRAVRADQSCLVVGCHARAAGQAPEQGAAPFDEGQLVGVISVRLPPGQTNTLLLFNRIFIVTAGVLACIIAVVIFYLITARLILQPVRLLREAADRLAVQEERQGEESAEAPPPVEGRRTGEAASTSWQQAMAITEKIRTGDEFERLARAFHEMLGRLKLAHDRLRETNRALDLQLGELTARNLALFESNKLKSEFLASVSHELRTPLNAILGFAEVVSERAGAQEDTKTRRYADNIVRSGKGLLNIINDLLDLAKIEAGRMEVRWQLCQVQEVAGALLQFARPLAEEKDLMMNLGVDERVSQIETDPGKLQQILFNLVSNAIKFTPHGGRIDVEITARDEEMIELQVRDTGPGIPQSQREHIFEKFRQVDQSVTREHEGTGLGLAIVKELVEMLGGSINVGGQEGAGASFTVLLPRRRPEQDATMRREQAKAPGSE
jgi:signal transduction histidine kinase